MSITFILYNNKAEKFLPPRKTFCLGLLRILYTYISSQKFYSIRISLLSDITKIWKNEPFKDVKKYFFIIVPLGKYKI